MNLKRVSGCLGRDCNKSRIDHCKKSEILEIQRESQLSKIEQIPILNQRKLQIEWKMPL